MEGYIVEIGLCGGGKAARTSNDRLDQYRWISAVGSVPLDQYRLRDV